MRSQAAHRPLPSPSAPSSNSSSSSGGGSGGSIANYPSLPPQSAQPIGRSRRSHQIYQPNHSSSSSSPAASPVVGSGGMLLSSVSDVNDSTTISPYQRHLITLPPPHHRTNRPSAHSAAAAAPAPVAAPHLLNNTHTNGRTLNRPHTGNGNMGRLHSTPPTLAFVGTSNGSAVVARSNASASRTSTNGNAILAPPAAAAAAASGRAASSVPASTTQIYSPNVSRYSSPSAPSLASTLLAGVSNVTTPRMQTNGIPAVNQLVPSVTNTATINGTHQNGRQSIATAPSPYSAAGRAAAVRIGSGRRRDPSIIAALDVTPKVGAHHSSPMQPWNNVTNGSMPSAAAHRAALAEEKQHQLALHSSAHNNNMTSSPPHYEQSSNAVAVAVAGVHDSKESSIAGGIRAVSARRTRVPIVTPATVTVSPAPAAVPTVGSSSSNTRQSLYSSYHNNASTTVSVSSSPLSVSLTPTTSSTSSRPPSRSVSQPRPSSGLSRSFSSTQPLSSSLLQSPASLAAVNGNGQYNASVGTATTGGSLQRPPSASVNLSRSGVLMPTTPSHTSNGAISRSPNASTVASSTSAGLNSTGRSDELKFSLAIPSPTHSDNNGSGSSGMESARSGGVESGRTSSRSSSPGSIIDVAVSEDPNPRYRPTMEDAHVIQLDMGSEKKHKVTNNKKPKHGYFAIYDGHGGRAAVDYISANLHKNVEKELSAISEHTQTSASSQTVNREAEAFHRAFLATDQAMAHESRYQETGATVAAALIRPSKTRPGGRDLFVANAGDSRIVLASVNGAGTMPMAVKLTHDHRPVTPGEIERVRKAGGAVIAGRVNGQLAVSRALGDHALKRHGVSAVPHQTAVALDKQHKFVIVGCDGLWDVVSDQEAVQAVAGMKSAKKMADKLVRMAMSRGTTDNVSVMAIRLRDD